MQHLANKCCNYTVGPDIQTNWILSVGQDVLTVWILYDTPPVVILPDATLGLEILQLYRRSRYTD